MFEDLMPFASRDKDGRFPLNHVCAVEGMACASDLTIMVVRPVMAGETETGWVIDYSKYPNFMNIINQHNWDFCPYKWPNIDARECPDCGHLGHTWKSIVCPECDGAGETTCSECGSDVKCVRCRGKGDIGNERECLKCNGKGVIRQDGSAGDKYIEWNGVWLRTWQVCAIRDLAKRAGHENEIQSYVPILKDENDSKAVLFKFGMYRGAVMTVRKDYMED